MGNSERMNVLVLGNSGAGKSTLISAIAGKEVHSNVGESGTQKIAIYESDNWPFTCIDTKGFEYNIIQQYITINQVKKFTKSQITNDEGSSGIDVVWYCIEGTSRRMFSDNIKMMNKSLKGWKRVPVFAVITKSYSEADIAENIDAVKEAFFKNSGINFKCAVPVVAEEYIINDDVSVLPHGLTELCTKTLECAPEAKEIKVENCNRLILQQKRYTANLFTSGATVTAIAIGATPFPFADSLILVPLETGLSRKILRIYDVDFDGDLIAAIVGSAAITNIAKMAISSLKAVPIAGQIINAVVAGFFVEALGEAIIALAEAIYTGKIDKNKIDGVVDFVLDKLKNNAILGTAIKYLEENTDKFNGKNAKELYAGVSKAIKEVVPKKNNEI